jgi:hypothetical protein
MVDYDRSLNWTDFPQERKVKGSSNMPGKLTIQWGKTSNDFNKVPYNYLDDAIKLAKGYLLQEAARIRDQVKLATSKVEIDGSVLQNQGDRWVEEVETNWKQRGFAVLVK